MDLNHRKGVCSALPKPLGHPTKKIRRKQKQYVSSATATPHPRREVGIRTRAFFVPEKIEVTVSLLSDNKFD